MEPIPWAPAGGSTHPFSSDPVIPFDPTTFVWQQHHHHHHHRHLLLLLLLLEIEGQTIDLTLHKVLPQRPSPPILTPSWVLGGMVLWSNKSSRMSAMVVIVQLLFCPCKKEQKSAKERGSSLNRTPRVPFLLGLNKRFPIKLS